MSQFPSVPPPGAYVPPNQTPQPQGFNQRQPHHGYQQSQTPSPHGAPAGYNPSASHKPTKAFGQVFNQAVTQGKPMLDKLGKTISSKLGSKQPKQPTPQHLENFQNFQQHQQQGQQYQQAPQNYQYQGQQYNQGPQSAYQTPQQSPFVQSSYGTPAPGNTGQSNYFPQRTPPLPPNQQSHQYQQAQQQSLNANAVEQNHNYGGQPPGQPAQGHFTQGQPQSFPAQTQYGQASGQQTGVIAVSQQHPQDAAQQPHQVAHTPSNASPAPSENQQQQMQWTAAPHASHHTPSPGPQSPTSFNPTPPPQQFNPAPPVPVHPNQQQQQAPPPQQQQETQQQQAPQPQHQQWRPMSPVSPQAQQMQHSPANSQPPQPSPVQKPATPTVSPEQQHNLPQHLNHAPIPGNQDPPLTSNPTEFIAELPADLGSMSIAENPTSEQSPTNPSQAAHYQAYRPVSGQNPSSGPGFNIPRRAVSTSSLPVANPWSFADPNTELPTREFYIIADLIFDGIDRRFEPQNTGLLEASKVLESWRAQQLPEEVVQLFAHDSYGAFAKIWSLEGVPHVMVPSQPALMPTWNFQQQIHSQALRIQEESSLEAAAYPMYMPALNRAGWYKYLFLNLLHQPEELEKMLSTFCTETYKPHILNQPDVQKRDRSEPPSLVSRATAISTRAVSRVCQEVAAQMQGT